MRAWRWILGLLLVPLVIALAFRVILLLILLGISAVLAIDGREIDSLPSAPLVAEAVAAAAALLAGWWTLRRIRAWEDPGAPAGDEEGPREDGRPDGGPRDGDH